MERPAHEESPRRKHRSDCHDQHTAGREYQGDLKQAAQATEAASANT